MTESEYSQILRDADKLNETIERLTNELKIALNLANDLTNNYEIVMERYVRINNMCRELNKIVKRINDRNRSDKND